MKDMMNSGKLGRIVAIFLFVIIFISTSQAVLSADQFTDVDVEVSSEEEVKVALYEDGTLLYSIEYKNFVVDTGEDIYNIQLDQMDWDLQVIEREDESFPHTDIQLSTELRYEGEFIGNLNFNIKVLTRGDTSEVTFSLTLSDIEHLDGGSINIVKDINTNGIMVREPEEGKENYKFEYQNGYVGYYGWKNELSFNGETTELQSKTIKDGGGLIILGDFEDDVDEVSIEPLEIEKTNIGAAVPVPEPYDHLPSFVIGLMLGAGIVIGVLAEKRREFYRNKDPEKIVKLEESYYYRGKE
ncbi:MAG: hypothetical protein ACOC53_06955 [Candidatus Saliniplasma sp.]